MKGMPYPHVTHYLQISLDAIEQTCFNDIATYINIVDRYSYLYHGIYMKGMPFPHLAHYLQMSLDAIGTDILAIDRIVGKLESSLQHACYEKYSVFC